MYISPPFGNYFRYANAISIRGTFTAYPRKGLVYHTLRSLRPVRGGWRNQIGFRNRGIANVKMSMDFNSVQSICGLSSQEWEILYYMIPQGTKIELNLSCPNVATISISDAQLQMFLHKFPQLIAKVRYDIPTKEVKRIVDMGVMNIHCSNTIPTPKGGISGKPLKTVNLPNIERIAKYSPNLIAGGGIYSPQDAKDYRDAGANDISISTVYITKPWNIPRIYGVFS